MSRSFRSVLFLAAVASILGGPVACGGWQPARTQPIESQAEPEANYRVVQDTLKAQKYRVIEQKDDARTVKVRSHVDEDAADRLTTISIQTKDDGTIAFAPSGYLVKPDGRIHRKLQRELDELRETISRKLGTPSTAPSATATAGNATEGVATAWNEPAYDPKIWGPGDFTCLPVKIPAEDQHKLKLQLSNGEQADLVLSLAYAPELCRSPAQCPVATGCPALGLGDANQVNRLAQRLVDKEIGEQATVLNDGEPVVTIQLTAHGLVSKAMSQLKPSKPAASGGAGWR